MRHWAWADGFHPPSGVEVDQLGAWIDDTDDPTPRTLFEASKQTEHVLHEKLWSEDDAVWADRGRLDYCRKILSACTKVTFIGGGIRKVKIRAVEFVRTDDGGGEWKKIEQIMADDSLRRAYLLEIIKLNEQAAAKLTRFLELSSFVDKPPPGGARRRKTRSGKAGDDGGIGLGATGAAR